MNRKSFADQSTKVVINPFPPFVAPKVLLAEDRFGFAFAGQDRIHAG